MSTLSKIRDISIKLKEQKLKKSGITPAYPYFELSDFLPKIIEEMKKSDLSIKIDYLKDKASLMICNEDKTDVETFELYYNENITNPLPVKGKTALQQMGEMMTYIKRHLLINAFNICGETNTLSEKQLTICKEVAEKLNGICNKIQHTSDTITVKALIHQGFEIRKNILLDENNKQILYIEPVKSAINRLFAFYKQNKDK